MSEIFSVHRSTDDVFRMIETWTNHDLALSVLREAENQIFNFYTPFLLINMQ